MASSKSARRKRAAVALRRYRALATISAQQAAMMEGIAERAEDARAALLTIRTPSARDAVMDYVGALESMLSKLAGRISENMEQMEAIEDAVREVYRADPLAGRVLALRYLGSLEPLGRGHGAGPEEGRGMGA